MLQGSLREFTQMCVDHSLVASTKKHKYYVIFVDDFSRKCWIFFMQKKDQTFSKFTVSLRHWWRKSRGRK